MKFKRQRFRSKSVMVVAGSLKLQISFTNSQGKASLVKYGRAESAGPCSELAPSPPAESTSSLRGESEPSAHSGVSPPGYMHRPLRPFLQAQASFSRSRTRHGQGPRFPGRLSGPVEFCGSCLLASPRRTVTRGAAGPSSASR